MREAGVRTVAAAQELIEAGEFDRAERVLRELHAAPDDPQILYLLGLSSYRAGRYGAALDAFGLLVQSLPDDPRALYSLAIVREKVGDREGADAALDRCLAIEPDFAPAREKLKALRTARAPANDVQDPERETLAGKLEDGARLAGPARLLASRPRRVSSIGGSVVGAILLSALGLVVAGSAERVAGRLAEWSLLGRTPGFFAQRLAQLDASGVSLGRASVQGDLDASIASLADRIASLTSILEVAGIALLLGAGAIVLAAAVGARLTRYDVYDHRIDVTKGLLRRRTQTLWLYALSDVVYEQPLWLLITGNARIRVTTDSGRPADIVGYGGADEVRALWAELRDAAIVERRAMRRWWV